MYCGIFDGLNSVLGRSSAYLDPGTGSYLIQLLLAALLGAGFLIKTYWQNILRFFKGGNSKSIDEKESEDE